MSISGFAFALPLLFAAAPDPVASPALALPKNVVTQVKAYRAAMAKLARASDAQHDDALCALFDAADATVKVLDAPLSAQRDASYSDDAKLDAFVNATKALQASVPGVRAAYGAAGMYVSRQDAELAKLARTAGARALLDAVAPLTTDWPAGLRQLTDDQGCDDPRAAVAPVENVTKTWTGAPKCLQARVAAALAPRFETLVEQGAQSAQRAQAAQAAQGGAFCDDEKRARADVEALAAAVEKLPALTNAKGAAAHVRAQAAAKDARFDVAKNPL
jgi:hypothetical protein